MSKTATQSGLKLSFDNFSLALEKLHLLTTIKQNEKDISLLNERQLQNRLFSPNMIISFQMDTAYQSLYTKM